MAKFLTLTLLFIMLSSIFAAENALTARPLPPAQDEAFFGSRMQRTMTLLKTSNKKLRQTVKILFYGQSIIAGMDWKKLIVELQRRYPDANIVAENRAIGGFTAPKLIRTAAHDLYSYYPDLVIFHVYTAYSGHLERIIYNIRKYTTAEIMLCTHQVASEADSAKRSENDDIASDMIRYIAQKYNCELVEVRNEWKNYLTTYKLSEKELMGDKINPNVHPNKEGNALLSEIILRHFRYNTFFPGGWFDMVRTYEVKRALEDPVENDELAFSGTAWKTLDEGALGTSSKDTLKLKFIGNRVDVIPTPFTGKLGTAKILVDGKAPSKSPEMYACTRPSPAYKESVRPALRRVTLGKNPTAEKWTLTVKNISDDAKTFNYELCGSVTGKDGEGNNREKFISNSGRIIIDPKDFGIKTAQDYKKVKCPENFEVTWEVKPMFVDIWKPLPIKDASLENAIPLFQGLENREHTLEIIPNDDGGVPVKSLVVYKPPLK
ncbi:MAG: hypothetical protein A2017_07885 [Lentisphaerae bacterium GWF2_44_16]|nr:MAG: hypothetical protein A2017_07885 [Lentisphaerae bacterium GWF2_44_16]